MLPIFSNIVLCLGCLFAIKTIQKTHSLSSKKAKPSISAIVISLAIAGISGMTGVIYHTFSELKPLYELFFTAQAFLGLPLIMLALISIYKKWHWQKTTWVRILPGLIAIFEMFRRFQLADLWYQSINYTSLILIAFILINTRTKQPAYSIFAILFHWFAIMLTANANNGLLGIAENSLANLFFALGYFGIIINASTICLDDKLPKN